MGIFFHPGDRTTPLSSIELSFMLVIPFSRIWCCDPCWRRHGCGSKAAIRSSGMVCIHCGRAGTHQGDAECVDVPGCAQPSVTLLNVRGTNTGMICATPVNRTFTSERKVRPPCSSSHTGCEIRIGYPGQATDAAITQPALLDLLADGPRSNARCCHRSGGQQRTGQTENQNVGWPVLMESHSSSKLTHVQPP